METVIGMLCVAMLMAAIAIFSVMVMKDGRLIRMLGLLDAQTATFSRNLRKQAGSVSIPLGGNGRELVRQENTETIWIDGSCTPSGKDLSFSNRDGRLVVFRDGEAAYASDIGIEGLSIWKAGGDRTIGITVLASGGVRGRSIPVRALFGSCAIPGLAE